MWWKNVTCNVSYSKFSQLSDSEKSLKIFQQLTKLPSAMQCLHFLDHHVFAYDDDNDDNGDDDDLYVYGAKYMLFTY